MLSQIVISRLNGFGQWETLVRGDRSLLLIPRWFLTLCIVYGPWTLARSLLLISVVIYKHKTCRACRTHIPVSATVYQCQQQVAQLGALKCRLSAAL